VIWNQHLPKKKSKERYRYTSLRGQYYADLFAGEEGDTSALVLRPRVGLQ
jgi:hypothetical protein